MLPDKDVRKLLSKTPIKIKPEIIKTSARKLGKKMVSPKDFDWIEMSIIGVSGSENDWAAILISEELNASISVEVNPMHASYIICSIKGLNDMLMYPTPYQIMENLATMLKTSTNCAVIDNNKEDLLYGKIEMMDRHGRTLYHDMSAADAITFAITTGKPLYMLRGLVNRLTD